MLAMHIANLAQASATRAMRAVGTAEAIGTAFSMTAAYPYTESEEDRAAAERQHAFSNDWFLRPLMAGGFPRGYVGQEGGVGESGIPPGGGEGNRAPPDLIGIHLFHP